VTAGRNGQASAAPRLRVEPAVPPVEP